MPDTAEHTGQTAAEHTNAVNAAEQAVIPRAWGYSAKSQNTNAEHSRTQPNTAPNTAPNTGLQRCMFIFDREPPLEGTKVLGMLIFPEHSAEHNTEHSTEHSVQPNTAFSRTLVHHT